MMLTVPLIFGSRTKLRPVISDTALTTASMSALTKLRVTRSSAAPAGSTAVAKATSATIHRKRRAADANIGGDSGGTLLKIGQQIRDGRQHERNAPLGRDGWAAPMIAWAFRR